jgi:glycolate oxidase FAD binding subunit
VRVLKPDTEKDVEDAIAEAFRSHTPLSLEGNGTKRALGHPASSQTTLKLAGLTGITMYEPEEMVFTARAGTALAEIEAALGKHGQCLAFEPSGAGATIGGIVAAGIAGPRRFAAGAARDHLLGFRAVNGKGESFKAGGRVVKNVTGYDLPKLAAGSFGTLFAMTELTLRALPKGASTVLVVEGWSPTQALPLLRAIARSPFEPSGLSYIAAQSLALIRLEGQADGVAARTHELRRTIARTARILDAEEGAQWFRKLAEVEPLFAPKTTLWRLSLPSSRAEEAIAALKPTNWAADWAAGLLLLEDPAADIHATAQQFGGHATLLRALVPTSNPFPPLDAATAALTSRIKDAFDPARILNPGRMYKDL